MRSLEDLQYQLERESSWRKKEIVALRTSAMQSSPTRSYFYRAGLVLVCAHWEGYLRQSIAAYINHVFAQRLRVKELAPSFVALSFFGDVKNAAEADFPGSANHHVKLAHRILRGLDEICPPPSWDVDTESNPGSSTVQRLLLTAGLDPRLGMDIATWETTCKFIDQQIVGERHLVAHGRGLPVEREVFVERSRRMLLLLDTLEGVILDSAESRSYRVIA